MTSPYALRPYQSHTAASVRAAWHGERRPTGQGSQNRPAAVLATGLGKTVIFSDLARQAHDEGKRTLILVHRKELADQAKRKLHDIAPKANIGIVKAEQDEWEGRDIVIGSIETLGRNSRRNRIPGTYFGLGIVDECHHAAADTWVNTMVHFGAFRGIPWAGFTATMMRGDTKKLDEIWPEIVAEYDINYGIDNGYLVPVRGIRVQVEDLMLDEVKRSRGDFTDADLGRALQNADAGNTIAAAYLEHSADKPAALFAPTVEAAEAFADSLEKAGVRAAVVTGDTKDRARIYQDFQEGRVKVLCTCMVLSEGWDAPWCETVIIARPTSHLGLYIQFVGRALRLWSHANKQDALVIDVIGASERYSLSSLIDVVGRSKNPYDDATDLPDLHNPTGASPPPETVKLYVAGELVTTEVDLFNNRPSVWLQTTKGSWFIPTRDSYWFIWPENTGGFAVARKPVNARRQDKVKRIESDLTLEGAMAWAEKYAIDEDPDISSNNVTWRKRKPSPKLVKYALSQGVSVDGLNAGEISDHLSINRASWVLPFRGV